MQDSTPRFPWPYPDPDVTTLVIKDEHITSIRALVAIWDIAETGAPGLILPDGGELEDHPLAPYVDMFLNAATLSPFTGSISNALLAAPMPADDRDELLGYIRDKDLRAVLSSETHIPFEADTMDLALWDAAQMGETGIDPKRPFGTGNVAKDMRAVMDPDNALSRGEFTKQKRERFSRLLLMLQLFVQQAHLKSGEYRNSPAQGWRHVDQIDDAPPMLNEYEWVSRTETPFFRAESSFCFDVRFYVFGNKKPANLAGTYAEVIKRFGLAKDYVTEYYGTAPNYLLDKALNCIDQWPETTGDHSQSFATHIAARTCNAIGDFAQAAALLDRARLVLPDPVIDLRQPVSPQETLWANMTVTRRGLGQISDDDFTALFNKPLTGGGTFNDRVTQIYEQDEPRGPEDYDATYSQLKLMRAMQVFQK